MKLPFLTAIILITLLGCQNTTGHGEHKTMSKQELIIKNVSNYTLSDIAKIRFIKSTDNKIELVASQIDLDKFKYENTENNFEIHKINNEDNPQLELNIFTDNVESIEANGCGNIEIGDVLNKTEASIEADGSGNLKVLMNTESITCSAIGTGNVIISGTIKTGTLDFNSVGNLNTKNLDIGNAKIKTTATGSQNH